MALPLHKAQGEARQRARHEPVARHSPCCPRGTSLHASVASPCGAHTRGAAGLPLCGFHPHLRKSGANTSKRKNRGAMAREAPFECNDHMWKLGATTPQSTGRGTPTREARARRAPFAMLSRGHITACWARTRGAAGLLLCGFDLHLRKSGASTSKRKKQRRDSARGTV